VGNIDNDPSGNAKVVTGSFQGMLRIYNPRERDFKIEDLMLEQNLEEPILQLEAGLFSSNGGMCIAVLHPRRLVIYSLVAVGSNQSQASYFNLQKNYEHKLERAAANFVFGSFGGIDPNTHYICLQSMDGQLAVYEHESFAFSRFLHNYLLPGPIHYSAKLDAFITCNSSFEVECYKYQVLAASSETKTDPDGGSALTQQKKVQVDWRFILGEAALEIQVGRFSRSLTTHQIDILVLGERNLYCLSEIGVPRMQLRFDYTPVCMALYKHADRQDTGGATDNVIVASSTGSMQVYKDTAQDHLIWAAKGDLVPVALQVAKFGGLKGLVVGLDDTGGLTLAYMGTDPPLNVVGGFEGKELNYEEMDDEHRQLLNVIRDATSDIKQEPTDKVTLRAQVPGQLDAGSSAIDDDDRYGGGRRRGLTLRIFVSYSGSGSVDNMQLSIKAPAPLTCSQDLLTIPSLKGSSRTPVIVPITLFIGANSLPPSNMVSVIASYTTNLGEPRTARTEVALPMCLFCEVVAPLKNAGYKITLDTNRMPPQLTQLFDDLVSNSVLANDLNQRSAANNVLTFQYFSGQDVTILVSKSAGRYRLQSGCFEALWLVAAELFRRLTAYFDSAGASSKGEGPFAVTFTETLPLQDFFNLIDEHFAARQKFSEIATKLAQRAHQFRSIQKRLLVRFKDRNPAPLQHLDVLLEGTFQQLNALGALMEACQKDLKGAADRLSAGCELVLLLIRCRFSLDDESFDVLRSYLSPVVNDLQDQGWEECTEAAMTHLLRTSLSKNAKEAVGLSTQLVALTDTNKLKKHIGLVCERLARGGKLNKDK